MRTRKSWDDEIITMRSLIILRQLAAKWFNFSPLINEYFIGKKSTRISYFK
jgi:hypothetical protein